MSEENTKAFTARKLDWVRCGMRDPLVPHTTYEVACRIVSHLNAKNGPPVRDFEKRALQRAAGLRSCSGRFWRVARPRQ